MFASLFRAEGGEDRSPWGNFFFEPVGLRSLAGVRVSADAAMRLTAVYACVRLLSSTMACLPFTLYSRKENGGKKVITNDWRYRLFAKRPNRWQNPFEWFEMMQGHIELRGAGYNRIMANPRGEVDELVPMHPDRVGIQLLASGDWRYSYKQADGSDLPLARDQVFAVRGFSSDGMKALNPIELARDALGGALAAQEYGARFFRNDARPLGGWIKYPGKFKDKAARDVFRDSWQQGQSGENRGKTAVLEDGMEWHEVGLNNKDSQFLELRQFNVPDIARIFGVPPHLIGDLSKSTNNNIEQQSLEFVMYTMTQRAERWEAAIKSTFIDDDEDLDVEFDFANLLRGDSAARAEFYTSGINAGWLVRNEARVRENLDPIDGLDEPLQPLNMAPAGKAPPADKQPGRRVPAKEEEPDGDEADARARALELAIAGRVVRKETVACRKAFDRFACAAAGAEGWRKWLVEFYGAHVEYVRESLLCPLETAAAWCDRQRDELLAATDQETRLFQAAGLQVIVPLLEAWEKSAAAELAARVQMSAQGAP